MTRVHQDKHRVRTDARAARIALTADERAAAATAVAEHLLGIPGVADARTVFGYAATNEELDPAPALEALLARGARVAYPRVCGPGEMTVHWANASDLAPGYCGILEPRSDAETARPEDVDLVLVPGVAFDEQCHRLGMGGGFYDRFLAELHPGALVIGLAFDEQLVERVPREDHDVRLDLVVTPTRVVSPQS